MCNYVILIFKFLILTDQLAEIRKITMSRIVCDNADKFLLANVAPNAFRKPGVPGYVLLYNK